MKDKILVLGLAFALLFGMEARNRAEADTKVSFSVFFDALAPYGNWVSVPEYGYAWYPYGVGSSWRPYSYGRWSWSDYGWIWISDEPWGWATYHYGRWVFDDYYGWLWLPGTVWAPAWVTWFTGPSYIGWAPLPPDYGFFYSDYGYYGHRYKHHHHHYHHHHYIKPSHCVFVPSHHFLHHNVHSVALNPSKNVTIIKNTNKVTNIKLVNNKLVNYGPSVSLVENSTGAKIRKVNVVDSDLRVIRGSASVNKLEGREYRVFRPKIVKEGKEAPVIKKDINGGTVQIDKKRGNIAPYKDQGKSLKKETLPSNHSFKEPDGQEYRINPAKKGNLLQTQGEEKRIPKNKKSIELGHSRKPSIKAGTSFVGEEKAITDYAHTYSNGGYPAYRKGKKENPMKTRDLIRGKKVEKASYKPAKFNESNEYKIGNVKNDRVYKNDFKKNSEMNGNSESRGYQPSKRTFNNQGSLRNGQRGLRH